MREGFIGSYLYYLSLLPLPWTGSYLQGCWQATCRPDRLQCISPHLTSSSPQIDSFAAGVNVFCCEVIRVSLEVGSPRHKHMYTPYTSTQRYINPYINYFWLFSLWSPWLCNFLFHCRQQSRLCQKNRLEVGNMWHQNLCPIRPGDATSLQDSRVTWVWMAEGILSNLLEK